MTPIDTIMNQGIRDGVFPGAVLLVSRGEQVPVHRAYGRESLFGNEPVTLDTCFDLASLTKPLATALAVATLVEAGTLTLEQPLGALVDCRNHRDKQMISIDQLLRHTAGFPAHRPFYRVLVKHPQAQRRDALRHLIMAEPLTAPPGTRQVYSDLGYMVLAWLVEATVGMRLDHYVEQAVFAPLGVDLFFNPLGEERSGRGKRRRFAATEQCPWRARVLTGEVHDDNAWAAGGVEGHAGLFGTARDVGRLLRYLLTALHGESGGKLPGRVLRRFVKKETGRERVAGFDTPSPGGSSAGQWFSANALGHLGFTGTSFWMEPDRSIAVVLLTNRVHPSRNNTAIRQFRPRLHDAVMERSGNGTALLQDSEIQQGADRFGA